MTFACLVRERYPSAIVYLFGSRARGTANPESDYDVVVVAPSFAGQRLFVRPVDLYALWWAAGGQGISLDLHCYTPDEFRRQIRGLGYLGSARRRGELHQVKMTGNRRGATTARSA